MYILIFHLNLSVSQIIEYCTFSGELLFWEYGLVYTFHYGLDSYSSTEQSWTAKIMKFRYKMPSIISSQALGKQIIHFNAEYILNSIFLIPRWVDLQQSLYDTYQYAQHHGWYEVWKQIIDLSDPHGEMNAYKVAINISRYKIDFITNKTYFQVLGVSRDASQQEITAIWRKLSRENHPDKEREPELRAKRQERFLEIQQAYEILSNTKLRRKRKNKKDTTDE